MQTIEIPGGILSTLSFMSEILGDYHTYSDGMITWTGATPRGDSFASLLWNDEGRTVEIFDGVEPIKGGEYAIYTIIGYCRYQAIKHTIHH